MTLIGDPIYLYFSKGFRGQPRKRGFLFHHLLVPRSPENLKKNFEIVHEAVSGSPKHFKEGLNLCRSKITAEGFSFRLRA